MLKILIADDHAIVRQGLKQILDGTSDLRVTGEAADGWEALEKVRQEDWDMVLLDISMPGINGLDLIKRIKAEKPRLPVLILSMHNENQFALRALKAGAAGYLTKESAPDLLVVAARKVAGGGRYVGPALAEKLAAELDPYQDRSAEHQLSDREYQVLRLIISGKNISDVAQELSLSVKTVSTHKVRIMRKLKVRNNVELIQYSLKHGLVG